MKAQPKTTRVRIKILVNGKGEYAAYGFDAVQNDEADEVLYDMMCSKDTATAREFWVTADIPIPQPVEVTAATVEPCDRAD